MSRHNTVPTSAPATSLATRVTSPESPKIKAFVRSAMERYGMTEEEVRKGAIEAYGSVERTMEAMEIGEAEEKAAMEMVSPNDLLACQVGRKPKPGEEVTYARLRDGLFIRVWGGDLERLEHYSLDFVNHECQYILAPDDVKMYTMETPYFPSTRVLSMEDAVEKAGAKTLYSHATRSDPNWETYLVHEGDVLRITQRNRPDRYLHIPVRAARDATLVLQPWKA